MASQLCSELPMQVETLHVLSMPDVVNIYPDMLAARTSLDQSQMENNALNQLKQVTKNHALQTKHHVSTGPVDAEICRWAKELRADIILLPTHGRSGMGRFLMGSVAEQVVRYAPCSVLSFCPKKAMPYRKKFIEKLEDEVD